MPSRPRSSERRRSPPYHSCRRSHSRSRSRSRSPPPRSRNADRPRASTGGFRWKDKSRAEDRHDNPDDRRLDRGYRDRDRDRRDRDRDRTDYRNGEVGRYRVDDKGDRHGDRDRERRRERIDDRYEGRGRDGEGKRDENTRRDEVKRDPFAEPDTPAEKLKKDKKEKKKEPKIAPTSEPLIIVNVNDRLGTKAAVPCLASDSIRTCNSFPFV